jgi:multiple antibiotic resistance protein
MEDAVTIPHKIAFVAAVLLVLILGYLIFAFSTKIVKYLGETGINVMLRIMGLIIMVIAVEFFKAGITPFINSFMN